MPQNKTIQKNNCPMLPKLDLAGLSTLSKAVAEIRLVDVPEWGGSVYVKALTSKERDAFEDENSVAKTVKGRQTFEINVKNIRARLLVRALVDENGAPLFPDRQEGAEILGNLNAAGANRVWDVAREMSGLTQEDVEELAGKSETTPDDDSSST
jgi:hypothetical protein